MEVFKIRRPDGLFSLGGYWPRWGKQGKVWTTRSGVKNHLTMVYSSHKNRRDPYEGCEVFIFQMLNPQGRVAVEEFYERKKA